MAARFGMVAAATLVAAVVLWATLQFDGPAAPTRSPEADAPDAPVVMPPGFDPGRTPEDDPAGVPVIREGERGVLRFEDETGQRITVLTYDRLTPRPAGVLDVQGLTLRVFYDTDRVLQITADRGTLIAPDNEPRQGDFVGDVVLTYFDGRGDRPDLTADADVVVRAYMDEARYDLDLGRVETIGPIHLTGPRMDFVGREMTLNYNEARGRIERLEIVRGQALRLKPDAGQPLDAPATDRPTDPAPAPQALPGPPDADAEPTEPADAVQFYRARFEDAVRVRSAGDGLALDGDYLEVVFSLRRGEADPGSLLSHRDGRAERFVPPTPRWPQHPLLAAAAATHWASFAQLPATPDKATEPLTGPKGPAPATPGRQAAEPDLDVADPAPAAPGLGPTLAPPGPDDIVVRWTGRLLVEPEPTPPPGLAPGDAVQLRLIGRPALARSADRQHLQGAEITYLSGRGRIGAAGTDAYPLLLSDPALGRLTGASLSIDPATGSGFVLGPGSLHTAADAPAAAADRDPAETPVEALSVTWTQRLDLTFDGTTETGPSDGWSGTAGGLGELRRAAFQGGVSAQHPRLALRADQLDVALAAGESAGQVESIDATGHVGVATRGDGDTSLTLRSGELSVTTAPDDRGRLQPTALSARGAVHATQPGVALDAQQLDVALTAGPEPPAAENAIADAGLRVSRLEARQAVRVELADSGVVLDGDRLIVLSGDQRLELLGLPGEEAHITRGDNRLAGPRIIVEEPTRRVHVPAGGFLEALLSPGTTPTRLRVSWRDAMAYDDVAGEAIFDGAVRATTHSTSESTELTGDRLAVRFELAEPDEAAQPAPPDAEPPAVTGNRRIAELDAAGRVVFAAQSVTVSETGRPETRLRLEGDTLTFNQHQELVTVPGAGRMLLEDFRRDDDAGAPPADAETPGDRGVAFTGRGETLFVWGGQMVIDVGLTDSVMDGGVQMVHRPEGGDPVVQLDAQVLMVDLTSTGGLGVWQSDRAVDTDVDLIRADGSVRIARQTRQITADHLRYDGPAQELLLTADPGRFVVVADRDQPTPLRGRAVKWNLETGRLELTEVTGGLAPIPGTRRE